MKGYYVSCLCPSRAPASGATRVLTKPVHLITNMNYFGLKIVYLASNGLPLSINDLIPK